MKHLAQYKDYYLMTCSDKGESKGKIIVVNREKDKIVYDFKTPYSGYDHPGGLQVIGDYAVVAIEDSKKSGSYIALYHLAGLSDKKESKPILLAGSFKRDNKTAAVGITHIEEEDGSLPA